MAELSKDYGAVLPFFMQRIVPSVTNIEQTMSYLAAILKTGGIVAYPTETFYGLGVLYSNESALERLYDLKQRPLGKAMPLIIGHEAQLRLLVTEVPESAERLMRQFWPGPLTIIFRALASLSPHITSGTGKVAVRIPGNSFAFDLARHLDWPITATSANVSGMPPASTAEEVIASFGSGVDAVIDCGKTPGNGPSTIVDVTGPGIKILRQGIISSALVLSAAHL